MASGKEAVSREGAVSPRKLLITSRTTPPVSPIKSPTDSAKSFPFAVDDTSSTGKYEGTLRHYIVPYITERAGARTVCVLQCRTFLSDLI